MDRLRSVVGVTVLVAALVMLGVAAHTGYQVVRERSARLPADYGSALNLSWSGPNASFAWTSEGYNVTFTDTSTDNGSTITAWLWEFGDGTTSADETPSVHTYATTCGSCNEQVTLAVSDEAGHQSVATANVTVQRTGGSNGEGTSPAQQLPIPSFGVLTSGLLPALELIAVLLLIGGSAAKAAWNLLRRDHTTVAIPVVSRRT